MSAGLKKYIETEIETIEAYNYNGLNCKYFH